MNTFENWTLKTDADNFEDPQDIVSFGGSLASENYILARFWNDYPNYEKVIKLILSAPQLLKSLRFLVNYVEQRHDWEYLEINNSEFIAIGELLRKLNDIF